MNLLKELYTMFVCFLMKMHPYFRRITQDAYNPTCEDFSLIYCVINE